MISLRPTNYATSPDNLSREQQTNPAQAATSIKKPYFSFFPYLHSYLAQTHIRTYSQSQSHFSWDDIPLNCRSLPIIVRLSPLPA